jgi:hypothetical protein
MDLWGGLMGIFDIGPGRDKRQAEIDLPAVWSRPLGCRDAMAEGCRGSPLSRVQPVDKPLYIFTLYDRSNCEERLSPSSGHSPASSTAHGPSAGSMRLGPNTQTPPSPPLRWAFYFLQKFPKKYIGRIRLRTNGEVTNAGWERAGRRLPPLGVSVG